MRTSSNDNPGPIERLALSDKRQVDVTAQFAAGVLAAFIVVGLAVMFLFAVAGDAPLIAP